MCRRSKRHPVCITANWNRNRQCSVAAEGEGKLTQDFASDKQGPSWDFALLWKKSKANEPEFEFPGDRRLGWHIECSMATDVLEN
jgi:cysteinyl-tRNA synthetase